jgi:hypothetical protein
LASSRPARRGSVASLALPLVFDHKQYGNVFTFVLLGRKVTVALSAKGSNFVLGGKSTAFNAEGAYTVRE